VISTRHRKRQSSFRSPGFCDFACLVYFLLFTRNHQLTWTIQIRQRNTRFTAGLASFSFTKPNDGRHATMRRFASFLHELAAHPNHPQAILEFHDSRHAKCCKFSEG